MPIDYKQLCDLRDEHTKEVLRLNLIIENQEQSIIDLGREIGRLVKIINKHEGMHDEL